MTPTPSFSIRESSLLRAYPGRVSGTGFTNPDLATILAMIGRAFGFRSTRLETVADLEAPPDLLPRPGPDIALVRTSTKAILPGPT